MREASRARKRSDWALEYDIWNQDILTSNKAIVENFLKYYFVQDPTLVCNDCSSWSIPYQKSQVTAAVYTAR